MKQRITALALCALLAVAFALETVVSRADTVYFTAANDTLLDLSDNTMPFWNNNLLYVPADVFSSGGLDISVSYNASKKTLILRNNQLRLICNLSSGMTVDSAGNVYDFTALERNGTVFLPINATCRVFGFSCVTRTVANGSLVRIRNDSASLSDDAFLTAAAPMIASRYTEYTTGRNNHTDSTDTAGKELYLALTVRSAADMSDWLNVCAVTVHRVTFFLTEDFLSDNTAECSDLVRRALSEGHALGLVSSSGNNGVSLEQLQAGNALLREIACVKTRFVQVPQQVKRSVENAGYCPVGFDFSTAGKTDLTAAEIYSLLTGPSVRLDLGDSISAASLRSLLSRATARGYTGHCFRETAY